LLPNTLGAEIVASRYVNSDGSIHLSRILITPTVLNRDSALPIIPIGIAQRLIFHPMASSNTGLGLLGVPRNIRDKIYQPLLVIPHPLYLFSDGASLKVGLFAPDRPSQWLALLHVNRQLRNEAVKTLYGSHQFVLVDTTRIQTNLLQSFLDLIGPINAGYLRHVCINFPVVVTDSQQEMKTLHVAEIDLLGLRLIREKCPGLTTLEMYVHSENSRGLATTATTMTAAQSEVSQNTMAALAQVDAELKTIPSLEKVTIRLFSGPLALEVAQLVESFGWHVLPGR